MRTILPPLSSLLLAGLVLSGCWKLDPDTLPETAVAFSPEGAEAPEGWTVVPFDVPLSCPNGEDARFYFLYPEQAAAEGTVLSAAVIYHSGAFDFVYAPSAEDPLAGTHYAVPGRLDSGWAIRNLFVTLGMLPEETDTEVHTGVLPTAFAEENVAMMFPANCWGDWWHNRSGQSGNAFELDLFGREGRTSAEWGYQFLTDPMFAAAFRIELPVLIDPESVYLVGLGEGGRAVTEVLSIDADEDGVADHTPAGALVDSLAEDLSIYYEDPSGYGNAVAGLTRIFDQTGVDDGSLATASLPERFGYLLALGDNQVPVTTHRRAMSLLLDDQTKWVYVDDADRHVLLNSDDLELARSAVSYLLTGVVPPPGDGAPPVP